MSSRGRVVIDLDRISGNVELLRSLAPRSSFCAVVKADGYGHGAVRVGEAALGAGADCLAVATPLEGEHLRAHGIGSPILLLTEPAPSEMAAVVGAGLTPILYSPEGVDAYALAVGTGASVSSGIDPREVHLMVDTGMNRVGATSADATAIAERLLSRGLIVHGVCTHLATADDPSSTVADAQLDLFDATLSALSSAGIEPVVRHAANSAGTIGIERSRYDLVRCGIAIYGLAPGPDCGTTIGLEPALSLSGTASFVKDVPPGQGISYGHRYTTTERSRIVTVSLGYGDGVPRGLGTSGGTVLCAGAEHRMAGVVTMDQFMFVDSTGGDVSVGDEVVLIGSQGHRSISADRWANCLDTINYEIVTRLGNRLSRSYVSG